MVFGKQSKKQSKKKLRKNNSKKKQTDRVWVNNLRKNFMKNDSYNIFEYHKLIIQTSLVTGWINIRLTHFMLFWQKSKPGRM